MGLCHAVSCWALANMSVEMSGRTFLRGSNYGLYLLGLSLTHPPMA